MTWYNKNGFIIYNIILVSQFIYPIHVLYFLSIQVWHLLHCDIGVLEVAQKI